MRTAMSETVVFRYMTAYSKGSAPLAEIQSRRAKRRYRRLPVHTSPHIAVSRQRFFVRSLRIGRRRSACRTLLRPCLPGTVRRRTRSATDRNPSNRTALPTAFSLRPQEDPNAGGSGRPPAPAGGKTRRQADTPTSGHPKPKTVPDTSQNITDQTFNTQKPTILGGHSDTSRIYLPVVQHACRLCKHLINNRWEW